MKFLRRLLILILTIILLINITTIAKYIFPMKYRDYIDMYANEHKLDPYFVAAVIKTESNFKKDAASKKNAQGLMQITPETGEWVAEKMGMKDFNIDDLKDPETNIKMGCWYLNNLKEEFDCNMDLVLAAYNGGRGNVQKWLKDSEHSKDGESLHYIPFKETDKYVKKVKSIYNIYRFLYKS